MKRKILFWVSFALLLVSFVPKTNAQDLNSIFNGITKTVTNKLGLEKKDASIVGTWKYVEPDCKLESDNVLAQLGSGIAESQVKGEMTKVLSKMGFKDGTTYVFNADSTYTSTVAGKTTKGTYTYNPQTKELVLVTNLGIRFKSHVSDGVGEKNMSMLFKADKLMSLAQSATNLMSKLSKSTKTSIANTVLQQYKGLQLGVKFERTK